MQLHVEVLSPIKQMPLFFPSGEASKFDREKIHTDGKPLQSLASYM